MQPTVAEVVLDEERQSRVWERVCAFSIVVVLLAAVTAVIVRGPAGGAPSPAEQLAQIRKFVHDERTARFEGTETDEHDDSKGGVGSRSQNTMRSTGELSLPDSSHWTEDSGDFAMEGVATADAIYERSADSIASLANEQWVKTPRPKESLPTPTPAPTPAPGVHQFGDVLHAVGAPSDVAIMLEHVTNVSQVGPGVIKGSVDVASVPGFTPDSGPVPDVTIELATDPEGRLVRMTSTTTGTDEESEGGGRFTWRTEVRFRDWGAPVQISVPSPDSIDPTPGIDEKGLAAFTAAPVLMPGNVPSAYQLTDASVMEAEDPEDCPEVDLAFEDPATFADTSTAAAPITDAGQDVDTGIYVTITAASCDASMVDDGDPVTVGGHPARLQHGNVKDDEYAVTLEVVVGATRMTVESDLPDAAVVDAMRRVVPFDLKSVRIYNGDS